MEEGIRITVVPPLNNLIVSLRDLGYSMETAIADIIDNSIDAEAKNIELIPVWNSNKSQLIISDDGFGMNEKTLIKAMNLSPLSCNAKRKEGSLGRYGLGLKTASFSQALKFTVVSKTKDSDMCGAYWDLEKITAEELFILKLTDQEVSQYKQFFIGKDSGTIVIWDKMDRVLNTCATVEIFNQRMRVLENYLAMVFHKFLDSNDFSLYLGNKKIRSWNPFYWNYPALQILPVTYVGSKRDIKVTAYILPKKDFLTDDDYISMSGVQGWIKHEGFYVYRNRRLLVAGGWLGLGGNRPWVQDEQHMLVRISIDISDSHDSEWNIDIKKSTSMPSADCIPMLKSIAEDARKRGRLALVKTIAHKHNGINHPSVEDSVWVNRSGLYRININHDLISEWISNHKEISEESLKDLFWLIESSVPIRQIVIENPVSEIGNDNNQFTEEDINYGLRIARKISSTMNIKGDELVNQLRSMIPFTEQPGLLKMILERDEGLK